MAGRIKLSSITPTQRKKIIDLLTIKPIQPDQNNTYKSKKQYKSKEPIRLWITKNKYLHLPYNFILRTTKKKCNMDRDHTPLKLTFKGKLRDYQVPIYKEALSHLKQNNAVNINVYPSFGKTVLSIYVANQLGFRSVILLKSNLIKIWKGTITKFLPDAKIWVPENKKTPPNDVDFYICMVDRIHHIPLDQLESIGTLIIDECHQFYTEKKGRAILNFLPKYTISLTATFTRNDGLYQVMNEICGYKRIVEKYEGKFTVYRLNTGFKMPIVSNSNGGADWQALRKAISTNNDRNKLILNIIKLLLGQAKKVLVLTWLKENHVDILMDILRPEIGASLDYLAGNKNSYKDSDCLVGTIGKIGTGFDENEACDNFGGKRLDTEIIAGSLKSVNLLEQMVGRVFRAPNPTIIHLVDNDSISLKHWTECRKWYKEQNTDIKYVNLDKLSKIYEV